MSEALPKGWAMAKLGDVCSKPQYGWTSKAAETGGVKYVRTTDISNGQIDWGNVPFCAEVPADFGKYRVQRDDILVSRAGSVGVSFRVKDVPPCDAVFASYLIRFNALDGVAPEYLALYLQSHDYWRNISELSAGIAVPNVNASKLASLEFPLAPLPEQRRIVAKLEMMLGKVDACQRRLDRIPALLKRFRQSVLAAACSGRLTADWRDANPEPESVHKIIERLKVASGREVVEVDTTELPFEIPDSWKCIKAQDLCRPSQIITYGVLKPVWVEHGIPTVRVQDMQRGKIIVTKVGECCPERARKFAKTTLEAGDLLIAKDGATLGKTAFVPPELAGGNITQHVLRFPVSYLVEAAYVRLIVDSQYGQDWMRLETKGVALPGVNVGDFRRMPIPLAPHAEQREIVRRVEQLFSLADQLETHYTKAKAHVDKLTQSLLARAFSGKLVSQDPNDEPASALLERVSPESAKSKRTGRRK